MEVRLGGLPLVLVPGSYRRESEAPRPTGVSRIGVVTYRRGGGQAVQRSGERYWQAVGALPAWEGQGLRAGPALRWEAAPSGWQAEVPVWSGVYRSAVHLVNGSRQFQLAGSAGGPSSGLSLVRSLAAAVVDATQQGSQLILAHEAAAYVSRIDLASGTYTTGAYQINARLVASDGQAPYIAPSGAGREREVRRYTSATAASNYPLDSPVLRLTSFAGYVWILTQQSLWQAKGGPPSLLFTHPPLLAADDGAFLVGHGTALYSWLAGRVHRADLTGTVRGWVPTGPAGLATRGAASACGFLWVVVQSPLSGRWQLWATPGRMATPQGFLLDWEREEPWYLVEEWEDAGAGAPVAVSGRHPDLDLLLNRWGASGIGLLQGLPRPNYPGLRPSFQVRSGLATALPLATVPWLGVGAVLAWLGDGGPVVQARLGWSSDAGVNWQWGSWQAVGGVHSGFAVLEERFAVPLTAASLQVQVEVSGITSWSPVLLGQWALAGLSNLSSSEGQGVSTQWTPRRRWRFAVQLVPPLPFGDGSADRRDPAGLAAPLWAAWRSGTVLSLQDIDGSGPWPVQIVQLRERWEGPRSGTGGVLELELGELA